jgi:hypothetical protein
MNRQKACPAGLAGGCERFDDLMVRQFNVFGRGRLRKASMPTPAAALGNLKDVRL